MPDFENCAHPPLQAVFAAAFGLLAGIVPAAAQSSGGGCGAAYHAALDTLNVAKGDDLAKAVANMRAADPVLPGRWIYSQALLGKTPKKSALSVERTCLEPVKVAGRMRCRRFGEAVATEPQGPTELEISSAPNPTELRVLKAVADLVEGRGAVPDIGPNGRYRWLAERATSDLKIYLTQPAHPALCSGGQEVVEFYATSLKPLQARVEAVDELVKKAYGLAAERVAAVASDAVGKPETPPAVTAVPSAGNAKTLQGLVASAVQPVLTAADVAAINNETSALAALQRAKQFLIAAQVAAQGSEDTAPRERILAAGRAVRMIEAAAYTEIYAARYHKYAAVAIALPREIQAVHKKACTCGG